MKTPIHMLAALPLIALVMAGCKETPQPPAAAQEDVAAPTGSLVLTDEQIKLAGIELVQAVRGGQGSLSLPGMIESDPAATQLVSAAIGGRVVSLTRNLGQSVAAGQTLAIIESQEAASLHADIEAAKARLVLAESNLSREQRLFDQKVSPEQDLILAKSVAAEARIALRLAQQKAAATGGGGGALNRIAVPARLSGLVVSRSVELGQMVAADAELFRVANLSRVAVKLALSPDDAGKVRPGMPLQVASGSRESVARIDFVSPVLDEATKQVNVLAVLDNRDSLWRVGEAVTATVPVTGMAPDAVTVPQSAIQTLDGKPTVFVRNKTGFMPVAVELGAVNGDRVIVTKGLTGTEALAGDNSFTLKAELGKDAGGGD